MVKPVRCPKCQGYDVRRSYPAGFMDDLMKRLGRPALRCRRCGFRYYRSVGPNECLGLPDSPSEPVEWEGLTPKN